MQYSKWIESLHRIKMVDFEAIHKFFHKNISPFLYFKPNSDIIASKTFSRLLHILTDSTTHLHSIFWHSHNLYWHSHCLYWLSHGLYCHFYGVYYTFRPIFDILRVSVLVHSIFTNPTTRRLHTLTGFYNTLTTSMGALLTSKVRHTASFCSLTAFTVMIQTKKLENCWIFS